jgi:hypothetical protein
MSLDYILTNFFYSYFLITIIYFVIARTKRIKCQNKENNCQNKFICHPEQQMWCQNKSEQGSDTCYYYRLIKILL